MTALRIVIVTYNWPPRNAIGTYRPYAWARHWSEAGAQVTVLTARKQPFDAPLDLALPKLDQVRVIECAYGGAADLAGWLTRHDSIRRIAKRAKGWVTRNTALAIDPRLGWRKAAQDVARRLAGEADVVVSTFRPAASHLLGCDMKMANPALLWVADYRDLWSQTPLRDLPAAARDAMQETELGSVGARADVITAVSDDMTCRLGELTGKRTLRVPNGFDLDEELVRRNLAEPPAKPEGPLRIVYTGTVYEGLQTPLPLLDALVALSEAGKLAAGGVTLDFFGARLEPVRKLAEDPRYAPFIRIFGHVPHDTAVAGQRAAGILLLLENPQPQSRGVLTGKLFEYIASGRPIMCVGSRPEYEIGQVLAATGTGRVFGPDQYGELGRAVTETLAGRGLYQAYCARIEEIFKYSRKQQARQFLEEINVSRSLR